jgi:hypothetical protein
MISTDVCPWSASCECATRWEEEANARWKCSRWVHGSPSEFCPHLDGGWEDYCVYLTVCNCLASVPTTEDCCGHNSLPLYTDARSTTTYGPGSRTRSACVLHRGQLCRRPRQQTASAFTKNKVTSAPLSTCISVYSWTDTRLPTHRSQHTHSARFRRNACALRQCLRMLVPATSLVLSMMPITLHLTSSRSEALGTRHRLKSTPTSSRRSMTYASCGRRSVVFKFCCGWTSAAEDSGR